MTLNSNKMLLMKSTTTSVAMGDFGYSHCDLKSDENSTSFHGSYHLSHCMGKPTICIGENKGADQLRGNREADQRLCFRYSDSTIPLLLISEISSFWLFSVLVQVGLCQTWSEPQIVGFLMHRLIYLFMFRSQWVRGI